MAEFIVMEDFPKNQNEFNTHFTVEQTCHVHLFQGRFSALPGVHVAVSLVKRQVPGMQKLRNKLSPAQ